MKHWGWTALETIAWLRICRLEILQRSYSIAKQCLSIQTIGPTFCTKRLLFRIMKKRSSEFCRIFTVAFDDYLKLGYVNVIDCPAGLVSPLKGLKYDETRFFVFFT